MIIHVYPILKVSLKIVHFLHTKGEKWLFSDPFTETSFRKLYFTECRVLSTHIRSILGQNVKDVIIRRQFYGF